MFSWCHWSHRKKKYKHPKPWVRTEIKMSPCDFDPAKRLSTLLTILRIIPLEISRQKYEDVSFPIAMMWGIRLSFPFILSPEKLSLSALEVCLSMHSLQLINMFLLVSSFSYMSCLQKEFLILRYINCPQSTVLIIMMRTAREKVKEKCVYKLCKHRFIVSPFLFLRMCSIWLFSG